MANNIKLGYWGTRGRAQVARLLLAYTGAQWEDVVYSDPAQWFGNDKLNLGFDFPNLPYLIDGDLKISEAIAIERYIIQRSENKELLGKNIHDAAKVSQVVGVLEDVRQNAGKLLFDKEYKSKLNETWEKIKPKFDYLEKFVGEKDWILGYLTLADFFVAQFSNYMNKLYPQEMKAYPSVQRIRNGIQNLAQVQEYYKRPNAVKGPFLPPNYAVINF